jgi:catechol 2,3-dioxygenase-like lactoylglutathione lyase family enzyme
VTTSPAPKDGLVLTHFLVVADQDRSRHFYQRLFDAQVVVERDPVIIDPNRTSAFLNVRVADIDKVYKEWSARGTEFLTEPTDHGSEIRAYIRDPDGHLIEVGQTTGVPS